MERKMPCKFCFKLLKVPLIHQPHCKLNPRRQKPPSREPQRKRFSGVSQRRKFSTIPCMYGDCCETFTMKSCLMKHVRCIHDAKAIEDAQIHEFENFKFFEEWKEQEEHLTFSYYSQQSGEIKKTRTKYFYCQRDGSAKSHKKSLEVDRKTERRRAIGRVKMGRHCISSMKVTTLESGSVVVRYHPTHSHPLNPEDVKFHPMSSSAGTLIDLGISLNKPAAVIQQNVKLNGSVIEEQTGKKHKDTVVVSTKLIKNRAKTTNRLVYHQDDDRSVMLLTENLSKEDPNLVLVYKPLGMPVQIGPEEINDLPGADQIFMYGIQTKEQRDVMAEGCQRAVVIGETGGTNHYGYQLLSVVVVDADGGWPVAHCVLNKSDEQCLQFFFRAVKDKCPDININCVVTDDDPKYINAMETGFGVRLRHLLCKWHLARDLKKQLSERANSLLVDEMFDALKPIVDTKNISSFRQSYGRFIAKYEKLAPRFVDYLKSRYLTRERAPKWASCFRCFSHGSIETTSLVESFHNRLKLGCTKKKLNKRIDLLIQFLLNMAEEDLRKRLFKINFHPPASTVKDCHEKGLAFPDSCVVELFENMWEVKSSPKSDVCFVVNRLKGECTDESCYSRCAETQCPDLCSHLYLCSCKYGEALCQHIHKVHALLNKRHTTVQGEVPREADSAVVIFLERPFYPTDREASKKRIRRNLRKLAALMDIEPLDDLILRKLDEDIGEITENVTAAVYSSV